MGDALSVPVMRTRLPRYCSTQSWFRFFHSLALSVAEVSLATGVLHATMYSFFVASS
jgi:hypothetical protein